MGKNNFGRKSQIVDDFAEMQNGLRRLDRKTVPVAPPPTNVVPIRRGPPPTDPAMVGRGAHIAALNEMCRRNFSDAHLRLVLDIAQNGMGYVEFIERCRKGDISATPADLARLDVLHEEPIKPAEEPEQQPIADGYIVSIALSQKYQLGREMLRRLGATDDDLRRHHAVCMEARMKTLSGVLKRFGASKRTREAGHMRINRWVLPDAMKAQLMQWWEGKFAASATPQTLSDELDAELGGQPALSEEAASVLDRLTRGAKRQRA